MKRYYSWHGKGGTHGQTANNTTLAGGGDNPLIGGGNTGWVFDSGLVSPDGPVDGMGVRRTLDGNVSYLRAEWEPGGLWEGIRAWVTIPAVPTSHFNFIRLTGPGDVPNLINLYYRSTGRFRLYEGGASISASESGVLAPGTYGVVVQANYADQLARFRVINTAGTVVHEWSGPVAHAQPVAGGRVGDIVAGSYGLDEMEIWSRVSWGSNDDGEWIPGDVDPYSEAPDPPPATSAVTHYNTAEGLTIGDLAPVGEGLGPQGMLLSNRRGVGGTVTVAGTGIHGSRSYRFLAAGGQSAYVQWGFSSSRAAFRAYLDIPETPSATTQVMILRNQMEEPVGRLALTMESQVLLQCDRGGTTTSVTLPGVVDYGRGPIRLELFVDTDTDTVKAAWGYEGEGRAGTGEITSRDLSGSPLALAELGKMHSTAWVADFRGDDLALNVRATDHIGAYASSYEVLTTVAADLPALEPGTPFELEGFGVGTWTQVPEPGVPTIPIVQDGTKATGVRPYTLDGGEASFDYDGAVQKVGYLRATRRILTAEGWKPLRSTLIT